MVRGELVEEGKWWRWRDEVWSSGKCAGGMGEWRSVTTIMSSGEGRSPSPIMVCAASEH